MTSAGTSVEANIEEARETSYWLRLLKDSGLIDTETADPITGDCEALVKIIAPLL